MSFYGTEVARSPDLAACDAALKGWPDVVYRTCLEYDLHHEVRLSKGRLRGFLEHLAREWAATGALQGSWESASEAWKLQGPPGAGHALIRLFRWEKLADLLETAHGAARGTGSTLLTRLLASQDAAALRTLQLGWRNYPVWGGFDPGDPDKHPAEGRPRARLMDLLGLPFSPSTPSLGYPRSERVVALRFEVSETHVPTVADAGWDNPWWIPAPTRGACGRARDVAGLAPGDLASGPRVQGLGELVLRNADAQTAVRKDPTDGRFAREVA